ncbi:uncharacterized protein LOC111268795 [Varroa jacobsoni]|uniref:uncharacterized protein LOC111268795 n=1 Tax=Varroa jacobsoni TaxID=62625 RepID=UPI000BFA6440|nr:uncharacterized protein LOC111268795 [Varroa jacobsoni]
MIPANLPSQRCPSLQVQVEDTVSYLMLVKIPWGHHRLSTGSTVPKGLKLRETDPAVSYAELRSFRVRGLMAEDNFMQTPLSDWSIVRELLYIQTIFELNR